MEQHIDFKYVSRTNNYRWIYLVALVYFLPGLVIFIFLPAVIFSVFEEWNYLDSFYSSFITLTTIGFGDIVPGHTGNLEFLTYTY